MNNKMGGAKRGLSVVGGALIVGAIAVLVIGLIFVGIGGQGGTEQEPQDEPTPTLTTVHGTAPEGSVEATPTETTSNQTTTSADSSVDIRRFEDHFAQRIEARNADMSVFDVETVENTVYVSVQGPDEGGWAQATNDDLAEAFTDALKVDWSNESVSYGIDHAIIALYDQNGDLYWNVRIEESWAYRYYSDDISLNKFTSYLLRSGHSDTDPWISEGEFVGNISNMKSVEFVSLEQYASTYFLAFETKNISESEYEEMMFEISEAFRDAIMGQKILALEYVRYNNQTAVASNQFNTGWGDSWEQGTISRQEYQESLVVNSYPASNIPGGIGSMLTRRTPFPADTPPE